MEIINVDPTIEGLPAVQCLANQMPTAASRTSLVYWIEKHYNPNEDPLVLIHFDRRDDETPGFKVICSEIDKTFVFTTGV